MFDVFQPFQNIQYDKITEIYVNNCLVQLKLDQTEEVNCYFLN
jgi:hypothetical protein